VKEYAARTHLRPEDDGEDVGQVRAEEAAQTLHQRGDRRQSASRLHGDGLAHRGRLRAIGL